MKRSGRVVRVVPARNRDLRPDELGPLGLLADSRFDLAGICAAMDQIDAYAWSSHGGWWADDDGAARRGWIQYRLIKGPTFLLQVFGVLGSGHADNSNVQRPGGGWLNVVVQRHDDDPGSSIEVRGDLDAEMHASVAEVLHRLHLTVVRTWDPTIP
jgi:hypothetical protein